MDHCIIIIFLQYVSMKVVNGQVIADFLADHPCLEVDSAKLIKIKPWQLYFDGSRHQGGVGVRVLIVSPLGTPTKFMFELKCACSNNEAEHEALIVRLEILVHMGVRNIHICGD